MSMMSGTGGCVSSQTVIESLHKENLDLKKQNKSLERKLRKFKRR